MLDHLPPRLLQRVVDEMVDTGWIKKINILFDSAMGTLYIEGSTSSVHQYVLSGSGWDDNPCDTVLSASARFSCSQPSIGSLTGFSIPCYLLCCYWRRSGHGLVRCQWNDLLRSFQTIHVCYGMRMEAPPFGTFCIDCD